MKQLIQSFRNGELKIIDSPVSNPDSNQVLVRTTASIVSAGTERAIAEFSEKSLLGKALARPDLVKQVIQKIKTEGIVNAAQASFSKLDMPLALGYSSGGVVLDAGNNVPGIVAGDRVACAGIGYASHAEMVVVPKNLIVKVPKKVSDEDAAFATIGAIALQGLRVADLRLGEKVVVIGLGLLGLITVQMLKASGCRVIGIDINPKKVEYGIQNGADGGAVPGDSAIKAIEEFTQGRGADAVLITAATVSNAPTELAGEISRLKGRVVYVGDVKMDIPRRTYYKKELDVRLSMSYGPGRYDPLYEEKGIDYPYAYVPFTEQRNMEIFLYLVQQGQVMPSKLVTHRFSLDQAESAYKLIKGETHEEFLGVVFTYPQQPPVLTRKIFISPQVDGVIKEDEFNIGLIGAGNYAKQKLLPGLKVLPQANFIGIATTTGISGLHTGEKYGFSYCTTDYKEILADKNINIVVIATRHNTHARITVEALASDKHVFVEKPLALNEEELHDVVAAADKADKHIVVGFNRRFSPLGMQAKAFFQGRKQPLCMIYRVNAGFIPQEHWTQDGEEGGGRVIGEVCHFVDFLQYMCGADPVSVFARGIDAGSLYAEDNLSITIHFSDGSIGSIHYFANGDKAVAKEYIEIFGEGKVVQIDDFCKGYFTQNGATKKYGGRIQDKGQENLLKAFYRSVLTGANSPISIKESVYTTLTTFQILEALKSKKNIDINKVQDAGSNLAKQSEGIV